MRKILMTTAAAVIAVPAMTAATMAQTSTEPGTGAGASTGTGMETGPANAGSAARNETAPTQTQDNANAGAQAQPGITIDTVVSSVEGSAAAAEQLSDMNEIRRIGVVRVDDSRGSEAAERVDQSVSANQGDVEQLREAIRNHAQLGPKLEAGGLDVSTIIAARVMPSGDVVLFTRA